MKSFNKVIPGVRLIITFAILSINFSFVYAQNSGNGKEWRREYNAVKISSDPKIDGRLDDTAWKNVTFDSSFLQREPVEGSEPSESTEFALLYNENNLYIGIKCFDSDPSGIRATEMRRDQPFDHDDCVEIILDTFDDKRSAFYFATNALGVRIDGKMSDEGKNMNMDWDGVWQCRSSIDDKGWYVEIAIPWKTLRFKEGDGNVWNANFIRQIRRKNEVDFWRLVSRNYGVNGKFVMSEAGKIKGFQGLKMGSNYEFIPYAAGGAANDRQTDFATKRKSDIGLDIKWNLSSTMAADFTYSTDFAQVEADQEKVNLERFSLYFPEKRGFFLEGAENFNFGHQTFLGYSDIQLFYSRRIGIEDGYGIPVLGGVRLQGKTGKYTVGVLSLQTERTTLPDESNSIVPETNFSALRIRRDVFSRSTISMMFLNKGNSMGSNRSFGIDSYFPVSDHLFISAEGAGTFTENNGIGINNRENYALKTEINYDSDLWDFSVYYLDIAENFNAEMGFIPRIDIRKTRVSAQYSPRPVNLASIRQFEFNLHGHYITDHNNFRIEGHYHSSNKILFENGGILEIHGRIEYEYFPWDWNIRPGITIPKGGYDKSSFEVKYVSARKEAVNSEIGFRAGNYIADGSIYTGIFKVEFKAFNRLRGSFDYKYNQVRFPFGKFHTNAAGTRLSYSLNPDLYVKAYIQLLDDKLLNNDMNVLSSNILLHYIYKPGSNFYVVYNEGRMLGPGNEIIDNRTLLTKFTYFFRNK